MNPTSATGLTVVLTLAALVAAGAAWFCTRWWYRRKLSAATARLRKSEQVRSMLQEQAQQARRQAEAVNKTLEAERAQAARLDASRRRARDLEASLRRPEPPPEAASREREPMDLALSMPMPLDDGPARSHDGRVDFADTQILN